MTLKRKPQPFTQTLPTFVATGLLAPWVPEPDAPVLDRHAKG